MNQTASLLCRYSLNMRWQQCQGKRAAIFQQGKKSPQDDLGSPLNQAQNKKRGPKASFPYSLPVGLADLFIEGTLRIKKRPVNSKKRCSSV
ncbi:hypothetical protein CSC82_10140 [Rhodobacteraceae bacterium 4F10]|nr:hypothetical protein CSC82_10140 [Rhodobacteraceae bacterium 4F10]